jgi:hypothetical protein
MKDYSSSNYAPWYSYRSSITTVVIEDGVTSIGNWAFIDLSVLTSVTIPESVIWIGNSVFAACISLNSVTIPNSVAWIGTRAFYNCSELTSVTIPNRLTSIGEYTFYNCSELTSVTIPNSMKSIGNSAFGGCSSLNSVTIPESVINIGNFAFSSCSGLTSVTIGNSVTSIGEYAFHGCSSLTSVTIGNSVTSIGDAAFGDCTALTAIDVSENNTVYASENGVLFNKEKSYLIKYPEGKPDASYTIPNSVTSIADVRTSYFYGAFDGCSRLTSVTIPNSVTSIGNAAFRDCSGLTSVTNLNPTPESIYNNKVFDNVDLSKVTLYVPASSVEKYKVAAIWKDFKEIKAYISSAIESPTVGSSINVYPNPVTESFRIGGITVPTDVTVTDLSGRIVLQQTVEADESVAAGNLPKGIYLVRVNGKTLKVVKR